MTAAAGGCGDPGGWPAGVAHSRQPSAPPRCAGWPVGWLGHDGCPAAPPPAQVAALRQLCWGRSQEHWGRQRHPSRSPPRRLLTCLPHASWAPLVLLWPLPRLPPLLLPCRHVRLLPSHAGLLLPLPHLLPLPQLLPLPHLLPPLLLLARCSPAPAGRTAAPASLGVPPPPTAAAGAASHPPSARGPSAPAAAPAAGGARQPRPAAAAPGRRPGCRHAVARLVARPGLPAPPPRLKR